jgi:heptaprenylglyceryl phosphate synthase
MNPDFSYVFASYVPLLDPDAFSDPAFYRELERIGYEQVLLGGTGSAGQAEVIRAIKRETSLSVVLYPSGPDAVCEADLVILPDVMNSNSHFARPFGSGSVATAMNVLSRGLPFLPIAYLILGNSTARWYFDAFTLPSVKVLMGYAAYARMVGYRYLALDYEDPKTPIDHKLVSALRELTDLHLVVSDEFTPETAAETLELGAQTVVTPSNLYESASDPLALAAEFHARLLRRP